MKKQLFSLALWMFFGFVLISAVDSILNFIINAYLFIGLWQELPVDFLIYSFTTLTILLYLITAILVLRFLKRELKKIQFENLRPPKKSIFILLIISTIFLSPIQNKLSGLILEDVFSREHEVYENAEFIEIYSIMNVTLENCKWFILIFLSIYFYRIYKKGEIKTEQ